ncbi:MAG: oxaloacetate decarboxylase [Alphaproteobacteria bacterium]|jgi:carboxyvinyl-carboxyphosphonate phosphorylmutase|nr:oxaloacetate decarboxylase [Alphaproteobacteria bacterium]PPR13264.1 MAG: Oxaloacetate decarboxylase [Alphaproteobacteria bacterium MarineAlpha12_Bin1]|tara:strand:- start:22981 stop:23829 length:849 start_codon:yes stop_codon:yes gene_type:complete
MKWDKRRKIFRSLLSKQECYFPGSVSDPLSARMAEEIGFEVGMFAGSIASMTVLGAPDLTLLTLSEFSDQAHRICRACELPIIVDADHGYGNALNVMRTVESLEIAGVSALSIEDTELPISFGSNNKPQLISVEEGVNKMRAALAARIDPNLVIMGRTSAPIMTDMDEVLKRVIAYAEVGVDVIFLVGLKSREDLNKVTQNIETPIMLGGISSDLSDKSYLASQNVKFCLQGHSPYFEGIKATYETLYKLRNDGKENHGNKDDLINKMTMEQEHLKLLKDYM